MLNKFFSLDFLFQINPINIERVDKAFLLIAVCLVVLAIGLKLYFRAARNEVTKKLLKRFYKLTLNIGWMGLVWFGARYENVKFFGSHFLFLMILLTGLVWLGFILTYWFRKFRSEKSSWEKEQLKLKYLNR